MRRKFYMFTGFGKVIQPGGDFKEDASPRLNKD